MDDIKTIFVDSSSPWSGALSLVQLQSCAWERWFVVEVCRNISRISFRVKIVPRCRGCVSFDFLPSVSYCSVLVILLLPCLLSLWKWLCSTSWGSGILLQRPGFFKALVSVDYLTNTEWFFLKRFTNVKMIFEVFYFKLAKTKSGLMSVKGFFGKIQLSGYIPFFLKVRKESNCRMCITKTWGFVYSMDNKLADCNLVAVEFRQHIF